MNSHFQSRVGPTRRAMSVACTSVGADKVIQLNAALDMRGLGWKSAQVNALGGCEWVEIGTKAELPSRRRNCKSASGAAFGRRNSYLPMGFFSISYSLFLFIF